MMGRALAGPALAGLVLAGLALAAASRPVAAQADVSLPLGTQAPSATVQDLSGKSVNLLDLVKGKPALIEFWATWCPLCARLQPQMDRIHEEYGKRLAVVAVGVAVNETARRIRRSLEKHDPGYSHVFDADGNAVRAYDVSTTSIVVMLDARGRVVYTGVGADQDLVGAVKKLLGESAD
ncbi:MAG: TlpA disulfide reductase family protein [Candidatus Palauibacterales bacterium]|nr:TlpA disulfide reductase family protein [Candidatus Palauibacterales bacterium]MDP2528414.1 TlpA disulfide reductase family protein [Candidatus Palauibacterales bacterium]MDP2585000.1 TlpA disulfide reductase family protein [Candidatus Palauibacterales bacterium]